MLGKLAITFKKKGKIFVEWLLPGTLLPMPEQAADDAFGALAPIFAVSGGGLSLSQITEMTGLGTSAVQNWVKRGWVAAPVNKRYDAKRVARILLINILRTVMKLEDIAALMEYINGDVENDQDDIIMEPQLYNLLTRAVHEAEYHKAADYESIAALINDLLSDYEEPVAGALDRLTVALITMMLGIAAAKLMQKVDELLDCEVYKNAPITRNHRYH